MFWLCLFVTSCLMLTGLDANENITHVGVCMELEFRCKNNQCIPLGLTCDVEPHCDDKSDEDEKMCEERECYPSAPFKCERTGTCLPKNLVCNGHEDCIYGEDEELELCQPDLPPPTFDIHLPGNLDETPVAAARVRRAAVADSRRVFHTILVENIRSFKKRKKSKKPYRPPSKRQTTSKSRMKKTTPYKRGSPGSD